MKIKQLVATCCLSLASTLVCAAPTQVNFSGLVTSKDSSTSGTLNSIDKTDLIQGYFIYDASAVTDSNAWDKVGQYAFNAANSQFVVNIYDSSNGGALLSHNQGFISEIVAE